MDTWQRLSRYGTLSTFLLAGAIGCTTPPSPRDSPLPFTVRHMDVNGTRLPYVEQGRGEPVVLVHGIMGDHRTWHTHMAPVARQYRAIAYSQRYFGSPPADPGAPKFGVNTHTADLAAFIRGLGAGPVHVVGWSYGASVGLALVQQHPELVKTAILYELSHPTYVTDPADLKVLTEDRAQFAPAVAAAKAGDEVAAARALFDAVGAGSNVLATMPADTQATVLENARSARLVLTAQEAPPPISCAQLAQIQRPVTVARGESTRPFYRVIGDTAARCMPRARHHVVPNATHLFPVIDSAGFSRMVVTLLESR